MAWLAPIPGSNGGKGLVTRTEKGRNPKTRGRQDTAINVNPEKRGEYKWEIRQDERREGFLGGSEKRKVQPERSQSFERGKERRRNSGTHVHRRRRKDRSPLRETG